MANSLVGVAVYLMPGQTVKIKSPVNVRNSHGFFPRKTDLTAAMIDGMADPSEIIRGFVVEDQSVGKIKESAEREVSILYTHRKAQQNAIWFFALTGEKGIVNVVSVPIHDHSSIVQGGPAYGTYFDDDSTAVDRQ
jgi:hypothetical protein